MNPELVTCQRQASHTQTSTNEIGVDGNAKQLEAKVIEFYEIDWLRGWI